jgi:hypothetical protein
MEVSGQLPASLPPEKELLGGIHLIGDWVCTRAGPDSVAKRKIFQCYPYTSRIVIRGLNVTKMLVILRRMFSCNHTDFKERNPCSFHIYKRVFSERNSSFKCFH